MEVLYLIRLFYRKLGIPLHKPYPRWGESPSPKTSRWPRAAQWLMKLKSCATKAGELPTSAVVLHPRKINMEPKNHPFEKGKNRPNLHFGVPCEFSRVYCCFMYNIPSLKIGLPKRKIGFQSSIFMCYVSFREGIPGTPLQLWWLGRFAGVKILIYNQGSNAIQGIIVLPTQTMQPLSGKSLKFTIDFRIPFHDPCKQYPKLILCWWIGGATSFVGLDSQALLFIPTERLKSDSWDVDSNISPR